MGKMMAKLKQKEEEKPTWETQAGNFTTLKKVNLDFCLPEFTVTKIVMWKCHMDESTTRR